MARMNWSAPGDRYYDNGVDQGVLYIGNDAVPWVGLISVTESPSGGEPRPYYIDGRKYLNLSSAEEFAATINAFSAPREFGPCDGTMAIQNGLFATQQPRKAFSMSYRTMIGNDTVGPRAGYKIHLIYNALAAPSERSNQTLGAEAEPNSYSWQISTLPPSLTGMKPTSHFVIDSRYTPRMLLSHIEDILYGTDASAPRIPLVSELVTLFQSEGPLTRQNYAIDPRFVSPTAWTGVDGTKGVTQSEAYSPNVTAVEGEVWTVSLDVTAPGTSDVTVSMAVRGTSAGAFGAISYSPTEYTIPAGETIRVSDTGVIPAGADGLRAYLGPVSLTDGTVKVDKALIEKATSALPYFDGDTLDEDANYYSWSGAPNNSVSEVNSWN